MHTAMDPRIVALVLCMQARVLPCAPPPKHPAPLHPQVLTPGRPPLAAPQGRWPAAWSLVRSILRVGRGGSHSSSEDSSEEELQMRLCELHSTIYLRAAGGSCVWASHLTPGAALLAAFCCSCARSMWREDVIRRVAPMEVRAAPLTTLRAAHPARPPSHCCHTQVFALLLPRIARFECPHARTDAPHQLAVQNRTAD